MNTVIFIVGPTAAGKTRLSIGLAKRLGGEVISCDSMQIYKGMGILSQAPRAKDKKGIRHYLIGVLDPRNEYSAASFSQRAGKIIDSIMKRTHIPIVVGGSGLYAKALIDGLFPSPQADSRFRSKMQDAISARGSKMLHKRLSKIDPSAAEKIHPNDARRIIRALEIYRTCGKTITELKLETKGLKDMYNIKIFGLTKPRDTLYSDIDSRVEKMFKEGVLREVSRLKKKRLSKTACAAIGFKEISGFLNGEYSLDKALELLKKNTRHFAKRQLTWFNADSRIRWFDVSRMSERKILRRIAKEVV